MKTGIYKITNHLNGNEYIGSTCSSFKKRWGLHKHHLRQNVHANIHLQRAWNKYKEENFTFSIIEVCAAEECIDREQYYIDLCKPSYNICKTAGSARGRIVRDKTRKLLSLANRGRRMTLEQRKKLSESSKGKIIASIRKKIDQYTTDGTYIASWDCAKSYAQSIAYYKEDSMVHKIQMCCRGIRKTAHGYIWKYK